jgi:hypothetical protein
MEAVKNWPGSVEIPSRNGVGVALTGFTGFTVHSEWGATVCSSEASAVQTVSGFVPSQSRRRLPDHKRRNRTLADLIFVLLTIGLFVILAVVVRLVERL